MCIAIPMQVEQILLEDNVAIVCLSGNKLTVDISLVSPEVGDFVLVHAGCALEIVTKKTAQEILDLFAELEELATNGD